MRKSKSSNVPVKTLRFFYKNHHIFLSKRLNVSIHSFLFQCHQIANKQALLFEQPSYIVLSIYVLIVENPWSQLALIANGGLYPFRNAVEIFGMVKLISHTYNFPLCGTPISGTVKASRTEQIPNQKSNVHSIAISSVSNSIRRK